MIVTMSIFIIITTTRFSSIFPFFSTTVFHEQDKTNQLKEIRVQNSFQQQIQFKIDPKLLTTRIASSSIIKVQLCHSQI